jgi:hypothetical protein
MEADGQPSAEPSPVEQVPAEQVQVQQVPVEHAPVQQVPVVQVPVQQVPVQQVPVQQAPAQPVRAEQVPAEQHAPASEVRVQASHADLDEAVDQVEAVDADGESPESMEESVGAEHWPEEFREVFRDMARGGGAQTQEMRQRREEFKNRAKEAELRLKKQDAELHEAPSAPSSER